MTETTAGRKTQAQRRAESSQAVLSSAVRLFGERGYAATSLEDIAADCGLTIRPIYHYFGNKKALFAAVNGLMEQRIVDAITTGASSADTEEGFIAIWRAYLALCDDPGFRRIVLIDSPNILGRERWADSEVTAKASKILDDRGGSLAAVMTNRVLMGALAEAALVVAEAEDVNAAKAEAEVLMSRLIQALVVIPGD